MEEFDKCDVSGERRLAISELSKLRKLFGEEVLTAVDADGKRVVDSLAALDTDESGDVTSMSCRRRGARGLGRRSTRGAV